MQNKIVELHKKESYRKKRAIGLKTQISTIRAISSNQPKMSQICLEEEMCLYRPNADSPRITAGELQRLIVLGSEGQKKKNSLYIPTCCSRGFQKKKCLLIQKQPPAYSVVRHNYNFKWDQFLWSVETKKMSFLAVNKPDDSGANREKLPHAHG